MNFGIRILDCGIFQSEIHNPQFDILTKILPTFVAARRVHVPAATSLSLYQSQGLPPLLHSSSLQCLSKSRSLGRRVRELARPTVKLARVRVPACPAPVYCRDRPAECWLTACLRVHRWSQVRLLSRVAACATNANGSSLD